MYRILALLSMALCTIALFTQSLYSQSSVCHDNNFGVDGCYGPFTGMTAVGTTTTFNQAANNSQGSIPVSNYPISLYTGGKPALAHFLPWFQVTSSDQSAPSFPIVSGNGYKAANGHVEIGYDSSQSTLINNQLRDIYQRGFSGVVVDWYGPFNAQGITRFEDTVTKNVNSAMVTQTGYCVTNLLCNLTFGIMEDQGAWLGVYPMGSGYTATAACSKNASDNTSCISTHIVNDIQYTVANYISSGNYLKTQANAINAAGNPNYAFFVDQTSWGSGTNWATVWSTASTSARGYNPPIQLVFENNGGFTQSGVIDPGAYAWVQPDNTGKPDGGYTYLNSFYSTAQSYNSQQSWGASYKGYDERMSAQSGEAQRGNYTLQGCGQVWLTTLSKFASPTQTASAFVQVPTWNDYDEGTEIESGIDNCISNSSFSASMSGATLNWSFDFTDAANGNISTIDHFSLGHGDYIPSASCSFAAPVVRCATDIAGYGLPLGQATSISVLAVGKNSVTTQQFPAVEVTPSCQASNDFALGFPSAPLYVTPGYTVGVSVGYAVLCGSPTAPTLVATGQPSGLTISSQWIPLSRTHVPSHYSVSVTASSTVAAGAYPITLTASGGGASHSVSLLVSVQKGGTITSAPSCVSIGQSGYQITGFGFGNSQSSVNGLVTFGGVNAAVTSWTDNTILVTAPPGAGTGTITVFSNGIPSNQFGYSVIQPGSQCRVAHQL